MTHEQDLNLKVCVSKYKIELTKEDVVSILNNQIALVESGIHVLDRRFPVPGSGRVDTVAVDKRNRLLLIDLGSVLDVKGLSNLFLQADWMAENLDVLRHIYPDRILDNSIRLWYLVGKILPEAESLLKRFDSSIPLELFTYDCVGFASERWLVIQPHSVEHLSVKPEKELADGQPLTLMSELQKVKDPKREDINHGLKNPILTQDEIDYFLSEDGHLQTGAKTDIEAVADNEDEITYVGPDLK